jgi:hypothetical protein
VAPASLRVVTISPSSWEVNRTGTGGALPNGTCDRTAKGTEHSTPGAARTRLSVRQFGLKVALRFLVGVATDSRGQID